MDAEHRPTSLMSDVRVSIIQVATRNRVFILDMLSLSHVLDDLDWSKFMSDYFAAPNITILGYGLRGDLRTIASSVDDLKSLENQCQSWLDVEVFEKVVTGATSGVMRPPFESDGRGLSALAEAYLGKPLDKRNQVT
jgi:hypothetical protein